MKKQHIQRLNTLNISKYGLQLTHLIDYICKLGSLTFKVQVFGMVTAVFIKLNLTHTGMSWNVLETICWSNEHLQK